MRAGAFSPETSALLPCSRRFEPGMPRALSTGSHLRGRPRTATIARAVTAALAPLLCVLCALQFAATASAAASIDSHHARRHQPEYGHVHLPRDRRRAQHAVERRRHRHLRLHGENVPAASAQFGNPSAVAVGRPPQRSRSRSGSGDRLPAPASRSSGTADLARIRGHLGSAHRRRRSSPLSRTGRLP